MPTIELYGRLVDTEWCRLETAKHRITTERAMLPVAALVDAVRMHVDDSKVLDARKALDDRKVLDAIGREVERIAVVDDSAGTTT